MITQLKYTEIAPPKKIEQLIIFIHGYGANGKDLLQLAPYFQKQFTNCHFIAPDAPYNTGYPNSYYWFPIENFTEDHLEKGVQNAAPLLAKFINYCKAKYNLTNQQITLLGFSQGSLLSLYCGLSQTEAFKAILSFSGGALSSINKIIKNQTPICLIHGLADEVLNAQYSINLAENFTQIKHPHKLKLINNLSHSINLEGLDFAINFLKK